MNKLILLGAASLLSLGIGAVSTTASSAASIASCQENLDSHVATGTDAVDANAASILAGLHAKGINATDVTDWAGCAQVDVVRPNGSTAMEFFDPSTLQRLHRNG